LTHAFDQRLFVVEQVGTVRVIESGQLRDEPFLDIGDRVGSRANEQGLLSMAFHPQYANREHPEFGRFFVNYTNKEGHTVIASFQVSGTDPNRADANSETILLTISQPFGNHNGGQVQFGPDGYLYVGMGDGGSGGDPQGNGQNPATLLGTILRLDVDQGDDESNYAIPDNNPFVNNGSSRNEIWATGLRNPWRFSFDGLTGDLYVADVGQNQWEEIHFQPGNSRGGENYGWNVMEASHCFNRDTCDQSGLELPIFEYDHRQGCSITGGYVYRGQQFPGLTGYYFAADFCSGAIWAIFRDTEGTWSVSKLLESGLRISSFGEDVNGELYVLDHGNGRVFQLQS
jgi:glucose/arabinose dehydrogenase